MIFLRFFVELRETRVLVIACSVFRFLLLYYTSPRPCYKITMTRENDHKRKRFIRFTAFH